MPYNKYCVVPMCKNSTVITPSKLFFQVPIDPKRRKRWMTVMKRADPIGPKTVAFCCEDHFDIENDMENYVKYKLVGGKLKLKRDACPHKFSCQEQTVKKNERSVVQKRRQRELIINKITSESIDEIFITGPAQESGSIEPSDPLEFDEEHQNEIHECETKNKKVQINDKKSEPTTSTTENDGKSTKSPPCDECQKPVDARELYRCVQCPLVVMCADCGRNNAHAQHCVLRMPSLQIYNKVEYLFELLAEVFHKKLSREDVDDDANDDGDDDHNEDGSDDDDKEEEIKKELESSVNQEDDGEDQNQSVDSAIPGPSKQLKSSASTLLSSWRDETSAPEPPDEAIPTSHIKTEPDTDPLACNPLFHILHTPTDEPKTKKRRTMTENALKKDNASELYTDEIVGNIKREEELEEVVQVKLEASDSDATLLDTEKYASYGSHRAGNTDF